MTDDADTSPKTPDALPQSGTVNGPNPVTGPPTERLVSFEHALILELGLDPTLIAQHSMRTRYISNLALIKWKGTLAIPLDRLQAAQDRANARLAAQADEDPVPAARPDPGYFIRKP